MAKNILTIVTTDMPATKTADHRVKAFGGGHTVTVEWDHDVPEQTNHIRAALKVARHFKVREGQATDVTRVGQRTKTKRGLTATVDLSR
jgi:predicted RND superfamily exporter protein